MSAKRISNETFETFDNGIKQSLRIQLLGRFKAKRISFFFFGSFRKEADSFCQRNILHLVSFHSSKFRMEIQQKYGKRNNFYNFISIIQSIGEDTADTARINQASQLTTIDD